MNDSMFQIHCRKSRANLHVKLHGCLDVDAARQLLDLIQDRYDGAGLVFLDTAALQDIQPQGADIFRSSFEQEPVVPIPRLFIKGHRGFEIAPEGCRVLVVPRKGCCKGNGACSGCSCRSSGDTAAVGEPGTPVKTCLC